jgi:nicotinate-nucleotide adenylyltransferase
MSETKIGILGGTFDPIHVGHLVVAEDVGRKLGLDEVLFVPAGQPWLKAERPVTAAEHRLEMVIRATASNPYFNVSTVELERPGPTYTVETMAELRAALAATAELYFMVGLDVLAELPQWKDPERLITMCRLVGMRRTGFEGFDLPSLDTAVPGASARVVILDTPLVDVSATGIRRRVAEGLPIRDLVPEPVEEYIAHQQLYT